MSTSRYSAPTARVPPLLPWPGGTLSALHTSQPWASSSQQMYSPARPEPPVTTALRAIVLLPHNLHNSTTYPTHTHPTTPPTHLPPPSRNF